MQRKGVSNCFIGAFMIGFGTSSLFKGSNLEQLGPFIKLNVTSYC